MASLHESPADASPVRRLNISRSPRISSPDAKRNIGADENTNLLYVERDDEFRAGTAHNWEVYKGQKEFYDEGVDSYFWRAHTLTVFFVVTGALCYTALLPPADSVENAKRGFVAVILLFLVFGVTHMPNGPFMRPHPIVWRLVYCISMLYELVLVFILFQAPNDARKLLVHLDPKLGVPLPEKSYGSTCAIYGWFLRCFFESFLDVKPE